MTILQSRRWQKLDADLTAVAASGLAAAWTAYTPTITSGTGTLTTASGSGRYLKVGTFVVFFVNAIVTTNGTGATSIVATLPFTSGASNGFLVGKEAGLTGKMLLGFTGGGATTVSMVFADGTGYPGGNGAICQTYGGYEAV